MIIYAWKYPCMEIATRMMFIFVRFPRISQRAIQSELLISPCLRNLKLRSLLNNISVLYQ